MFGLGVLGGCRVAAPPPLGAPLIQTMSNMTAYNGEKEIPILVYRLQCLQCAKYFPCSYFPTVHLLSQSLFCLLEYSPKIR
jgi:hypothetical protein